jgi:hypothetical protein
MISTSEKDRQQKEDLYQRLWTYIIRNLEPSIKVKVDDSVLREIVWLMTEWIYNRDRFRIKI